MKIIEGRLYPEEIKCPYCNGSGCEECFNGMYTETIFDFVPLKLFKINKILEENRRVKLSRENLFISFGNKDDWEEKYVQVCQIINKFGDEIPKINIIKCENGYEVVKCQS